MDISPPLTPQTSPKQSPTLIIFVIISLLVAVGVIGYFMTQSPETSSFLSDDISSNTKIVSIFQHVTTDTSAYGSDDDSMYTFLQGHDDELSYCTAFDESKDGITATDLADPSVAAMIMTRTGSSLAMDVTDAMTYVMNIDNGLLTDLCNHQGDIWALVLSADLQTMTPYHFTGTQGDYRMSAYNPLLTESGYGALYFDHISDTVIVGTSFVEEDNLANWSYYALDSNSGATDLIESCTRDAQEATVVLTCSREYKP